MFGMKFLTVTIGFITVAAMYSCSKGKTTQPEEKEEKIIVLEKGSSKPISGATIALLKCNRYDVQFGCIEYATITTRITDSKGEIIYSGIKDVEAIGVSHSDYWEAFKKITAGSVLLSPYAWVQVHINRAGSYNSGDYVHVTATRECNNCGVNNFFMNYEENIGLPADTTFNVKVEATENTQVNWQLISPTPNVPFNIIKSGSSQPFVLNKSDTIRLNFQY